MLTNPELAREPAKSVLGCCPVMIKPEAGHAVICSIVNALTWPPCKRSPSNSQTKPDIMKQLTIFSVILILLSCNNAADTSPSEAKVNVDSLTAQFVAGWNNKDSAALSNAIAEDAIVMNDSLIFKGHPDIAQQWISSGLKVLGNISVSSIVKNSDDSVAFDGGTYTLDLSPPGAPVFKEKGNYSFAWTKQAGGEWKLTLIHIEDVSKVPDLR